MCRWIALISQYVYLFFDTVTGSLHPSHRRREPLLLEDLLINAPHPITSVQGFISPIRKTNHRGLSQKRTVITILYLKYTLIVN